MMATECQLLSLEVPCDPHAPKAVREVLTATYDGSWSLEDGLLVASELVTNAVRHSGCMDAQNLRVDIGRHADRLLISVRDPGLSEKVAEPARADRSEVGGWGLALIERLCLCWGSERLGGYRVWAELQAEGTSSV